jgi:hypothetical protein
VTNEFEAHEAADRLVDAERLLPEENPETRDPDDAAHWLSVYSDMLQNKAAMLAALTERLSQQTEEDARREVRRTDAVVLERELKWLQSRVDFWQARIRELGAND